MYAPAVEIVRCVEHRPRRLLEAIARRVPFVASEACGLGGDVRALTMRNPV
jgi:hypothetical protein